MVTKGRSRLLDALLAAVGGAAVAALIGGRPGVLAAPVCALVGYRLLRRVEPTALRDQRRRAAADLPFAVDLVAATLRAGLPVDRAVGAVAEAVGGPLEESLGRVARGLALGLTAELAWAPIRRIGGGDRLASTMLRSAHSGAALSATLGRLADDLRSGQQAATRAVVARSAVLIVLPLGLCFLPAFVFAGVVPVIVAVLGGVLK